MVRRKSQVPPANNQLSNVFWFCGLSQLHFRGVKLSLFYNFTQLAKHQSRSGLDYSLHFLTLAAKAREHLYHSYGKKVLQSVLLCFHSVSVRSNQRARLNAWYRNSSFHDRVAPLENCAISWVQLLHSSRHEMRGRSRDWKVKETQAMECFCDFGQMRTFTWFLTPDMKLKNVRMFSWSHSFTTLLIIKIIGILIYFKKKITIMKIDLTKSYALSTFLAFAANVAWHRISKLINYHPCLSHYKFSCVPLWAYLLSLLCGL